MTVVGLGREGLAVTRVLAAEGARVTVSDTRDAAALSAQVAALDGLPVRLSLGGNRPDEALDCDLLVLSPGVDKRAPLVREAVRRGIPISSETALLFERCPAPIIGVTGSDGKTTTTTLIGEMLRHGEERGAGRPVMVGGNIGQPLLERLGEITPDTWVVLELSSFQLEWLAASPHVAAVTSITPNHLDRHETMEAYVAAKSHIVAYQGRGDVAVLNGDDDRVIALAERTCARVLLFSMTARVEDGACLEGDDLMVVRGGRHVTCCRVDELRVPGRHNVANALAAAAVAGSCGVDVAAIGATLRRFRGVRHRLQQVGHVGGITFYNDSIATTPHRANAALRAFDCPVILILGGHDKRLPWEGLAESAVERCRGIVLIGEAAGLIRAALEEALARSGPASLLRRAAIVEERSMEAAVGRARALAHPGDVVALSPGCASYDMYRDFEERGDEFTRAVERLEQGV